MSILKGSYATRRYRVLGDISDNWRDAFERAICAHALVPLDPERNEEKSVGWANAQDDQDTNLSASKWLIDRRVVLLLRIDTLKAPPAEVKRLLRIRQREIEAQRKEPLSAAALRELKDMIAMDLRRRTPPKTRVATMVWDIDNQRVFLDSHSKSVNEAFLTLFAQTFNIALDLEGPGYWAKQMVDADRLARLRPDALLLRGFRDLRPCAAGAVDLEETTLDEVAATENADLQDRRFLGREFLTWLLFAASGEHGLTVPATDECDAFRVAIGERIRMKALGEGVGEFTARGTAPAETADVRYCMAGGHTVRACDLFFTRGDRTFYATVLAESFDLARVRQPSLLSEEDTDRLYERLTLADELEAMLRAAYAAFLDVRLNRWLATLSDMSEWLRVSLAT